jgi:hypothetical protein
MSFDFNYAGAQRSFDLIPDGTIAVVHLTIRPGDAGLDGILKRTKNGDAEGLDCELTVVDGEYAKRKLWSYMLVGGTTDGHAQAADISIRRLRAIIESARGILPTDVSEAAKKARVVGYADFDGIRFLCKIGVEPARDGYKAKNIVAEVITPDRKEWYAVEQGTTPAAATKPAGNEPAPIAKPAWA